MGGRWWGTTDRTEEKAEKLTALLTQPGRTHDVSSPDLPTVIGGRVERSGPSRDIPARLPIRRTPVLPFCLREST